MTSKPPNTNNVQSMGVRNSHNHLLHDQCAKSKLASKKSQLHTSLTLLLNHYTYGSFHIYHELLAAGNINWHAIQTRRLILSSRGSCHDNWWAFHSSYGGLSCNIHLSTDAPPYTYTLHITHKKTKLIILAIGKNVPSVLRHCWMGIRKNIRPVKIEWWGPGVVIGLQPGANDLHMVQLMPLPLPSSFAALKSRLVWPFLCRLAQAVLK